MNSLGHLCRWLAILYICPCRSCSQGWQSTGKVAPSTRTNGCCSGNIGFTFGDRYYHAVRSCTGRTSAPPTLGHSPGSYPQLVADRVRVEEINRARQTSRGTPLHTELCCRLRFTHSHQTSLLPLPSSSVWLAPYQFEAREGERGREKSTFTLIYFSLPYSFEGPCKMTAGWGKWAKANDSSESSLCGLHLSRFSFI